MTHFILRFLVGAFLLGISICVSAQHRWGNVNYQHAPWVSNTSRPFTITQGLQNRHIAINTSHGIYYDTKKNEWAWQRPRLYCTSEDVFTQTFTIPYIIPMLERAGAVVFSSRERDWQRKEAVVDNDSGIRGGQYLEEDGQHAWQTSDYAGFAHVQSTYRNGENPFFHGTARLCMATDNVRKLSKAQWTPLIPADGRYAVYVSYQTFWESVPDAHYTVYHKGGMTQFTVNQQMGGGTWVYLGTFDFAAGENTQGMVVLTNESESKGVVSADAVRFGGGMGIIARGPAGRTSGRPRFLEGARYNIQWSGFPPLVYNGNEGNDDYKDDINSRSYATNYLNGGSVYCPDSLGVRVPIELQLGFHSDAGYKADNSFEGPMTICTTEHNDQLSYPAGISRMTSYTLASQMLNSVCAELSQTFGIDWPAREVRDRDYSESSRAHIPSMIFEMLSHQNWADMRYAHDPAFKFALSRAVYKNTLRYLCNVHDSKFVVAPLPVRAFAIQRTDHSNQVLLSWQPTADAFELSSQPSGYVVYTRANGGGFNNGQYVKGNSIRMNLTPGVRYGFKVTAVNEGGESLDSEVLTAYLSPQENKNHTTVLIVNGFNRLSGPKPICSDEELGFDLLTDAGVPFQYSPGFTGAQINFDRSKLGGSRRSTETGHSGSELEGMLIAGNTFDYPDIHGRAIQAHPGFSYVSCSKEALEKGFVKTNHYAMIDLLLGLEKNDGWSLRPYKTFSTELQEVLEHYMKHGGRMLVSGAFLASDMQAPEERAFTQRVLKYSWDTTLAPTQQAHSTLMGCGIQFTIPRTLNERQYAVQTCDCLRPVNDPAGFAAFAYTENNSCAGIAYRKDNYRVMALGFPFESITGEKEREQLMGAMLHYLLN